MKNDTESKHEPSRAELYEQFEYFASVLRSKKAAQRSVQKISRDAPDVRHGLSEKPEGSATAIQRPAQKDSQRTADSYRAER